MVLVCLLVVCVLVSQGHGQGQSPQPTTAPPGDNGEQATLTPIEIFNEHVKHEAQHLYTSFDYNHDGIFDKADLPLFIQAYDLDKNGTIEIGEYELNFDMQEPTLALVARGLFVEFDANSNGHVDLSDLDALYNRMDLNKDGATNSGEFEEYMTQVMTVLVILLVDGQEFQ